MISDGDSNVYEAVKHIYTNKLFKGFIVLEAPNNDPSTYSIDEDFNERLLSQFSSEQYKANVIIKEDCINHVKRRVSTYLKTLKGRYSGFEKLNEENLTSVTDKKKHTEVKNDSSSDPNEQSSSESDSNIPSLVPSITRGHRRRRLTDGKPYGGGVGRMTKLMERKLADSYGLAIRQSSALAKSIVIVFNMCKTMFYYRPR